MAANNIDYVLWGVFVILLVLTLAKIVCMTDNFLVEGFGLNCIDFIPYKSTPEYEIRPDTIFVSVASYRDAECSMTLDTIFNNADHPERIFVGICEQNKKDEPDESCISPLVSKYINNIRVKSLDYTEAKGPTYARYYCADLWKGEQYFFQIDSHTTFVKHWDTDIVNMHKQIKSDPNESNKPVLSVFPPTKDQMILQGVPEFDNGELPENNILKIYCGWTEISDKPKRSNKCWAAAGFMFLESTFLYEVPFDPNLSHLFGGEEVLFSARLFTHGYDYYTPNKNICYHHYSRTKAPNYSRDVTNSAECRGNAEKRVLFLLGLLPRNSVVDDFLQNTNKYGLGTFRTISDFWNASGVDFEFRTVERWNDKALPSKKYDGWWFRRDGWAKIKKWE